MQINVSSFMMVTISFIVYQMGIIIVEWWIVWYQIYNDDHNNQRNNDSNHDVCFTEKQSVEPLMMTIGIRIRINS